MPAGKPAGVRCTHLTDALQCALYGDERRPAVCEDFAADPEFCGDTREQALELLAQLEVQSAPDVVRRGGGA